VNFAEYSDLARNRWSIRHWSTVRAVFFGTGLTRGGNLSIEVSGTADGAIAKYSPHAEGLFGILSYEDKEPFKIKIDTKRWQDLLKRLFNIGVRDWEKRSLPVIVELDCDSWGFELFNRDAGDTLAVFHGCGSGEPPNWPDVVNALRDFIKEIIKIPLDAEYKKRFGTPISDFEASILLVSFEKNTVIRAKPDGVIKATHDLESYDDSYFDMDNWLTVSASDWLDIVRALGSIDAAETPKWGNAHIELPTGRFGERRKKIPADDDFKKIMDGINAKIKNAAGR
jgi:hypothetical protein